MSWISYNRRVNLIIISLFYVFIIFVYIYKIIQRIRSTYDIIIYGNHPSSIIIYRILKKYRPEMRVLWCANMLRSHIAYELSQDNFLTYTTCMDGWQGSYCFTDANREDVQALGLQMGISADIVNYAYQKFIRNCMRVPYPETMPSFFSKEEPRYVYKYQYKGVMPAAHNFSMVNLTIKQNSSHRIEISNHKQEHLYANKLIITENGNMPAIFDMLSPYARAKSGSLKYKLIAPLKEIQMNTAASVRRKGNEIMLYDGNAYVSYVEPIVTYNGNFNATALTFEHPKDMIVGAWSKPVSCYIMDMINPYPVKGVYAFTYANMPPSHHPFRDSMIVAFMILDIMKAR